ncbi:DUF2249 domain-containing protein [Dyella sp. A6]|uniref:DUF2249 domain-containing protein n=1 Tax=Dyella aluminiiresistens TaxID=3069105 RepID=UPI002E7729A7|nr:DUF2249 domain-containing protein [Dyella sp. A6]
MIQMQPVAEQHIHVFDARGVARRFRHSAIFGAMDALRSGETMRFVNDHDPIPLIAQLRNRFGDNLTVTYRERGPETVVIDFGITELPPQ